MTTPTLREAADQALKALEAYPFDDSCWRDKYQPVIADLRAAPVGDAQPVAWLHSVENDAGDQDYALAFSPDNFPLKGLGGFKSLHVQPLYATPVAQPAPQALSDEQIISIVDGLIRSVAFNRGIAVEIGIRVGRAIERAHGITATPAPTTPKE